MPTFHDGSRPSKFEADLYETLTWVKKGGSYDMVPRKQICVSTFVIDKQQMQSHVNA